MKLDISYLAKLTRIGFTEEELPEVESKMEELIHILDKLPLEYESGNFLAEENNVMPLRKDKIGDSLKREEVLANAPQKQAGCIVVPQTV